MNTKVYLNNDEMPKQWFNLMGEFRTTVHPPVDPEGNPVTPDALLRYFPENLIEQEVSTQKWITIPEEVLEIISRWRPTPLHRATALEKALGTPAKIYYKNESVSPAGSHKPNTAVAQAYYNKQAGVKKLTTEK
jgi:tryptophan synthase beta chain